jgi:hypothetical protein
MSGVSSQWSADFTEHTHITEIKSPSHRTNNQNYESQICHHLDRREKCRRFDLTTSLRDASTNIPGGEDADNNDDTTTHTEIEPVSHLGAQKIVDYFQVASELK